MVSITTDTTASNNKRQTDRQTTDNRRQAGGEMITAGSQDGRKAGKKLKNPTEKAKKRTPQSNFKTFSPSGLFRGMGGLPKNSAYLKIDYFCSMHILVDIPQGPLIGFEYYGPDEEYDFNELQISLLIIRFTLTWH